MARIESFPINGRIVEIPLVCVFIIIGIILLSAFYFCFYYLLPFVVLYLGYLFFKKQKVSIPKSGNYKVAVIGSGFSGLNTAIELKRNGIPFILFERDARLGGTWWENTYPGCECDVASHVYSFSFELNPVSIFLSFLSLINIIFLTFF